MQKCKKIDFKQIFFMTSHSQDSLLINVNGYSVAVMII